MLVLSKKTRTHPTFNAFFCKGRVSSSQGHAWQAVQKGAARSLQQLGDSKGSFIMLLVAFLWSLTSTFDKMGMAAAPTLATYLAVQRAITAVPCVVFLLVKDISSFRCCQPLLSPAQVPQCADDLLCGYKTPHRMSEGWDLTWWRPVLDTSRQEGATMVAYSLWRACPY